MVKKGSVQNKHPNVLHMGINCYRQTTTATTTTTDDTL